VKSFVDTKVDKAIKQINVRASAEQTVA